MFVEAFGRVWELFWCAFVNSCVFRIFPQNRVLRESDYLCDGGSGFALGGGKKSASGFLLKYGIFPPLARKSVKISTAVNSGEKERRRMRESCLSMVGLGLSCVLLKPILL